MMFQKDILNRITDIVKPVVENEGLELVDIEFKIECGRRILRVFVDKENGVNVEDCAGISRKINSLADINGLIQEDYNLEVSSPGLDRVLKSESDFVKFVNKLIRLKISNPINGQRNFIGYLRGCKDKNITLEERDSGKMFEINLSNISQAKLVVSV